MSLSAHEGSPVLFAWGNLCPVTGFSKTTRTGTGEPVRFLCIGSILATAEKIIGFFIFWFFSVVAFQDRREIAVHPRIRTV